jgi:hypothetical protein
MTLTPSNRDMKGKSFAIVSNEQTRDIFLTIAGLPILSAGPPHQASSPYAETIQNAELVKRVVLRVYLYAPLPLALPSLFYILRTPSITHRACCRISRRGSWLTVSRAQYCTYMHWQLRLKSSDLVLVFLEKSRRVDAFQFPCLSKSAQPCSDLNAYPPLRLRKPGSLLAHCDGAKVKRIRKVLLVAAVKDVPSHHIYILY